MQPLPGRAAAPQGGLVVTQRYGAVPTVYRGIQMRSALEAKWACVFDYLGLRWEYEPLALGGYIPDFLVDVDLYPGQGRVATRPLLVECRPLWDSAEYEEPIAKIARSGWTGAAMVVGCTIRNKVLFQDEPQQWFGYAHPAACPGHANASSHEWFKVGYQYDGPAAGTFCHGATGDLTELWRLATNAVRWMPPSRS